MVAPIRLERHPLATSMWTSWIKCAAACLIAVTSLGCAPEARRARFGDATATRTPSADTAEANAEAGEPTAPDGTVAIAQGQQPSRPTPSDAGWLGVKLGTASGESAASGARVVEVVRRSPAAAAGLAAGDIIVELDGDAISSPKSLISRIRTLAARTEISVGILRDQERRQFSIRLDAAPNPDELLERRFVGALAPSLDNVVVVSGDLQARWTALRGQVVLLEFWSPWCGVCQLMHQRLNEWQSQWAMHGVKVIGIAALGPDATRAYAARFGIAYAVASDEEEITFRSYAVFAVPSLFLVDRRGVIVDASTGYSSSRLAVMEKKLISLLGRDGSE